MTRMRSQVRALYRPFSSPSMPGPCRRPSLLSRHRFLWLRPRPWATMTGRACRPDGCSVRVQVGSLVSPVRSHLANKSVNHLDVWCGKDTARAERERRSPFVPRGRNVDGSPCATLARGAREVGGRARRACRESAVLPPFPDVDELTAFRPPRVRVAVVQNMRSLWRAPG